MSNKCDYLLKMARRLIAREGSHTKYLLLSAISVLVAICMRSVDARQVQPVVRPHGCPTLNRLIDGFKDVSLEERCLSYTRFIVLDPVYRKVMYGSIYPPTVQEYVVDVELKRGLTELQKGDCAAAARLWNTAISDQKVSFANIVDPGTAKFARGDYRGGFNWYNFNYTDWMASRWISDGNYFSQVRDGLYEGSTGDFNAARTEFERSLTIDSTGADALYFLEVVALAKHDLETAFSLLSRNILVADPALDTREVSSFLAQGAYLWMKDHDSRSTLKSAGRTCGGLP